MIVPPQPPPTTPTKPPRAATNQPTTCRGEQLQQQVKELQADAADARSRLAALVKAQDQLRAEGDKRVAAAKAAAAAEREAAAARHAAKVRKLQEAAREQVGMRDEATTTRVLCFSCQSHGCSVTGGREQAAA